MAWFNFGRSKPEERSSLEDPAIPLSDVAAWRTVLGEWSNVAGVTVNADTALEVPAIWCAVNFLSNTIASMPLQLYGKRGDSRDIRPNDTLYGLLHDAPNAEWTSFGWRKYSMMNTLLTGRSFTFIERNAAGNVVNLWPLEPARVTIERVAGRKRYTYHDDGRTIVYRAEEVIDVPFALKPDGLDHVHPVGKLKGAIGLSLALEQYAQRFFSNGGVPPMALIGAVGGPEAAQRAKSDVRRLVKEANRAGDTILNLPPGYELKPVGFDPAKGQMLEARRFQVEEVARIYSLPPVFLQDLTHGTFSNTEQQDLNVVKHTLSHWVKAWEQELNLKLFRSGRNTKFVEFNMDGLLRGDFKTRMDGYRAAIQSGINTPDEVRALENWPARGGPADDLYMQGATVPIGTVLTGQAKADAEAVAAKEEQPAPKEANGKV